MFYRKLISALVFAAFGFCFSGAAIAQDCNNPDFCWDFGIPVTVDNFTGSSVSCVLDPGGAGDPFNTVHLSTGPYDPPTFTQKGTATCTQFPDEGPSIPLGTCTFDLTWTGVRLSSCDPKTNSFNASLFCQDIGGGGGPTVTGKITPTVTGQITCPDSKQVIELGIAGITGIGRDTCADVFPAVNGFQKGQVFRRRCCDGEIRRRRRVKNTGQQSRNQKSLADARGSELKVHTPWAGGDRRNRLSHQNRRGQQRKQDVAVAALM